MENNKKTNTLIIGASSKLSKQYIEKYGVHKSNFYGVSSKVQGDIKDSNITIYEYKTAKKIKNIHLLHKEIMEKYMHPMKIGKAFEPNGAS